MSQVLVLNQDFSPLTVCSVQRAFILVFSEKAELIKNEPSKELRSITNSFKFPSVIKINRYINIPFKSVVLTKQNVFKRDDFQCQYCGSKSKLTLDHLIPKSKGGTTSWKNLVTACEKCNISKGNHNLEETNLSLRTHPKKPTYLSFLKKHISKSNVLWAEFL